MAELAAAKELWLKGKGIYAMADDLVSIASKGIKLKAAGGDVSLESDKNVTVTSTDLASLTAGGTSVTVGKDGAKIATAKDIVFDAGLTGSITLLAGGWCLKIGTDGVKIIDDALGTGAGPSTRTVALGKVGLQVNVMGNKLNVESMRIAADTGANRLILPKVGPATLGKMAGLGV